MPRSERGVFSVASSGWAFSHSSVLTAARDGTIMAWPRPGDQQALLPRLNANTGFLADLHLCIICPVPKAWIRPLVEESSLKPHEKGVTVKNWNLYLKTDPKKTKKKLGRCSEGEDLWVILGKLISFSSLHFGQTDQS